MRTTIVLLLLFCTGVVGAECSVRGSGDMGIVIERARGSVQVIDTSAHKVLSRIEGLGDLSHASAVYSRDGRYAYIFGRDGGLSKVDILCGVMTQRIIQAGNSIGGAISQDGTLVAVSNYQPGGVKIFSADTLALVAEIPATAIGANKGSKTVGLVDAPESRFVVSLYDSGEIWIIDTTHPTKPTVEKFKEVGRQPYDALITPDGRYYIAGLFGQDGLSMLDLWHPEKGPRLILGEYGKGTQRLPVYKMPHLEGWAMAGDLAFLPGVGRHQVVVAQRTDWKQIASIPVYGQPVFVVARPDGRQVWVNFAFPHNDTIQIIDTERRQVIKTLKPGKGALHMEFTPRGEELWLSVRDRDEVQIYNTRTLQRTHTLSVDKPSGIFFTARAHKTGL